MGVLKSMPGLLIFCFSQHGITLIASGEEAFPKRRRASWSGASLQ